jgi:TetR/AcrR family transcriptional regulator
MSALQQPPAPRRVGRPRLEGEPTDVSPRDGVLVAAAKLFSEKGYTNTTMSDIARAAGLHQSSLYYWFKRKEMVLQATLEINRLPVEFLEKIRSESGPAALKLFRLIRFDTYQLCTSAFDITEVERQAEQQPDVFIEYWKDNQRLYEGVEALIRTGIDEGDMVVGEPRLMALGLLSTQEGIQKRFRNQGLHALASENPFVHRAFTPEEAAEMVAEMAVRSVLRSDDDFERVRQLAESYQDF